MTTRRNSTSFGPNAEVELNIKLFGSHRDENFRDLYHETSMNFRKVFQLDAYDLLFLPGGGTLGVEATIASSKGPVEIVGCEGVFRERWSEMASIYNLRKTGAPTALSCHLETSVSSYQEIGTPILDAVSSFPYYAIPNTCDVFILATNKQLRSLAGLTIIGVRKSKFENYFDDKKLSYLSLARYRESAKNCEMPSTVGTYLFEMLNRSVTRFDLATHRQQIDDVSTMFVEQLGEAAFVGDLCGPVLTVRKESIPEELAQTWNLYEKTVPLPTYQIFTYSTNLPNYVSFLKQLKIRKKNAH